MPATMGFMAIQTPSPRRALVIDDEKALATLVAGYLERDGFEVHLAYDGPEGLDAARSVDPDVVVLDLGLPGLDGVEVCRQLRTFSDCYVVMLTARADEIDTLIGLSVGADDYMTKPFSPRELQARIAALLRRPRRAAHGIESPSDPLRIGALSIDLPPARCSWRASLCHSRGRSSTCSQPLPPARTSSSPAAS